MAPPDTTKLDLNLLKILDALYQCGSTVKAAERLGVSQSRVSQSLARLREALDDPLFIRAQGRLQPTARATALSQYLSHMLPELYTHCFDPGTFEPAQYNGRINIMISAILIDALGPEVLAQLTTLLPKAKLVLKQWSPSTVEAFNNEEINIGINHFPLSIGKNIRQLPIAKDLPIVTMRQGHPKAKTDLTLAELVECQLAGAIIPDLTEHQSLVESVGKEHNIEFTVRSDNLPALFKATLKSDLIMIGLALPSYHRPPGLISFVPNFYSELPAVDMSVAIYYRQSLAQDPRIVFLESQLRQVIEGRCQAAIDSLDQLE